LDSRAESGRADFNPALGPAVFDIMDLNITTESVRQLVRKVYLERYASKPIDMATSTASSTAPRPLTVHEQGRLDRRRELFQSQASTAHGTAKDLERYERFLAD
jgi:hypothetical protein